MMARLLEALGKRLGGRSDEQLAQEIDEARQRLRAFRRENQRFRENAHRAVDETRLRARDAVDVLLRHTADIQHPLEPVPGPNGDPSDVERLGALALVAGYTPDELMARWHAIVDEHGAFCDLTIAEFEGTDATLAAEVRDREVELERRRVAAEKAAAEAALDDLEKRAAKA